jgi:hypothetical protein
MLGTGRPETGLRIGVVVLSVVVPGVVVLGVVVLGVLGLAADGLAAPTVTYNRSTGAVSVDTSDGTLLVSIVVSGPEATSIDRWQDASFEDDVLWTQSFFQGAEQWAATGWMQNPSQGQSFVDPGTYQLATYATGLGTGDFSADVEIGTQLDMSGNNPGSTLFVPLTIESSGTPGDYNGDGFVDAADYTLFQDNLGNSSAVLGGNGSGAATVVQADYLLWAQNFTGLGTSTSSAVPEPSGLLLLIVVLSALWSVRLRQSDR